MNSELLQLSRQELTRTACDAIAAQGKKPSLNLVREWTLARAGAKKGSDGDVQKDIAQWFDDLLKLKRDQAVGGLPDAVASLARDFWRTALEAARHSLEQDYEALEAERRKVRGEVAAAEERIRNTNEAMRELEGLLALARQQAEARDGHLKRVEEDLSLARAAVAAKDERIDALTAELTRKSSEQTAARAELDGVRRHSLLQVDEARQQARHWKEAFERLSQESQASVEASRRSAGALENELSAMRGRMGALEESLARATQRADALEAQAKKQAGPGAATHLANRPAAARMVRRRRA